MIWDTGHTKALGIWIILVAACIGAAAYTHSLIVRAENDATQKTEAKYQKMLADQNAAFEKRIAARDEQTKAQVQAMRDIVAKLKTPQQHAEFDQQALTDAIKGIQFKVQSTGEMTATIPKESIPQATAAIEECKECETKLAASVQNLADREAQMKLAQQQIDSLKTQRDSALTAAKGGGFWKRLKSNVKWLVIGAAGGAIAAKTLGH